MAQTKKSTSTGKKTSGGSSAKSKKPAAPVPPVDPVVPIRRELGAVMFLFLALFVGISYFRPEGSFILFFSNLVKGLVGWGYWVTAPAFLLISVILAFHKGRPVALRVFCALLLPILFAAMMSLVLYNAPAGEIDVKQFSGQLFEQGQALVSGGLLGGLISVAMESALSIYGALPVIGAALVFCVICSFRFNVQKVADKVRIQATAKYDPAMYEDALAPVVAEHGAKTGTKIERISRGEYSADLPLGDDEDALLPGGRIAGDKGVKRGKAAKAQDKVNPTSGVIPMTAEEAANIAGVSLMSASEEAVIPARTPKAIPVSGEISDPPKKNKSIKAEVEAETIAISESIADGEPATEYQYPPMSLLHAGAAAAADSREEISLNKDRLDMALKSFGISSTIKGVTRGPTVTRYDVELDQGVKLARVTNLSNDLALSLGVGNVRIAPIPDKISTIGIEVPNKIVSTVYLRDIIDTPKFASAKSRLSFALGKDISGEGIIGNIAKLPHMLIAGTTGSGKSVCMNCLIISLLYKARPDEVRLIMIDPKMVELGVYNGIPHLYVPVVTDPKKAAGALQWSVVEMLKRYRLFSEAGVRDLESYNKHCAAAEEQTLPQVIIVIDELADLMLVASKEVEESICRVAQMGRAAGMHLVIATQRPSADVITGLMKANIPSRIAFAVSSAMESRIILDQSGAEKLMGMGDMLFSPVGCGKPTRIQGAFVSDEEREDVIQFIKEGAAETQENSEIEEYMSKAAEDKKNGDGSKSSKDEGLAGDYDELVPKAVEVMLELKSCSVTMLQRKLKLGYARAARIMDQLEELGVVGPFEGSKPRPVLIDREGWKEIMGSFGFVQEDDLALAAELSDDEGDEADYDN